MERKKSSKIKIIAGIVIGIAAIVFAVVMIFSGSKDAEVEVSASGIEIKGMVGVNGVSLNYSDMISVTLIEKSMEEIGIGRRTGGSSSGGFLKGNFEDNLLFVKADSSPTLHITRNGEKDIYISFSNSQETRELYNKIKTAKGE